jgi:hypothetical protein
MESRRERHQDRQDWRKRKKMRMCWQEQEKGKKDVMEGTGKEVEVEGGQREFAHRQTAWKDQVVEEEEAYASPLQSRKVTTLLTTKRRRRRN